jgi:hypothetical protein
MALLDWLPCCGARRKQDKDAESVSRRGEELGQGQWAVDWCFSAAAGVGFGVAAGVGVAVSFARRVEAIGLVDRCSIV